MKKTKHLAFTIALITQTSHAAIALSANGSTTWTGDGTISANSLFVSGFSGTGTMKNILMARDGTTLNITATLIPFDPNLPHSANFSGGTLSNLINVKGFEITGDFAQPIAAIGPAQGIGASLGLFPTQSDSIEFEATLGGIIEVLDATTAQRGLSTNADFYISPPAGFGSHTNEGTLAAGSLTGNYSGTWPGSTASNAQSWIRFGGVDSERNGAWNGATDSPSNGIVDGDFEPFYIQTITWSGIDTNGQALNPDSQFRFSVQGKQYDDSFKQALAVVPEPSSIFLTFLGLAALSFHRTR